MKTKDLLEASEHAWTDGIQWIAKHYYQARKDTDFGMHWDNHVKVVSNLDDARAKYFDEPTQAALENLWYWYQFYQIDDLHVRARFD